jgi:hypothetical protein
LGITVVPVDSTSLKAQGYNSFRHWTQHTRHVYIGRDLSFCIPGAKASLFENPFPISQNDRLYPSLEQYRTYVRGAKRFSTNYQH